MLIGLTRCATIRTSLFARAPPRREAQRELRRRGDKRRGLFAAAKEEEAAAAAAVHGWLGPELLMLKDGRGRFGGVSVDGCGGSTPCRITALHGGWAETNANFVKTERVDTGDRRKELLGEKPREKSASEEEARIKLRQGENSAGKQERSEKEGKACCRSLDHLRAVNTTARSLWKLRVFQLFPPFFFIICLCASGIPCSNAAVLLATVHIIHFVHMCLDALCVCSVSVL